MAINYYSMGLADSSGISGVFEAPSGSCFFDEQENQLYISLNSGWVGINKQIEIHKVSLGQGVIASGTFNAIPMTSVMISGLYMYNNGPGVRVNASGIYAIAVQTSIEDVEMRLATNLGQLSLISNNKHLRDIFMLREDEQVNLLVRRARGINVNLLQNQFIMFMENR